MSLEDTLTDITFNNAFAPKPFNPTMTLAEFKVWFDENFEILSKNCAQGFRYFQFMVDTKEKLATVVDEETKRTPETKIKVGYQKIFYKTKRSPKLKKKGEDAKSVYGYNINYKLMRKALSISGK